MRRFDYERFFICFFCASHITSTAQSQSKLEKQISMRTGEDKRLCEERGSPIEISRQSLHSAASAQGWQKFRGMRACQLKTIACVLKITELKAALSLPCQRLNAVRYKIDGALEIF